MFHDWDYSHGLIVDGGGILFGDGHLEEGVGKELAIGAARAGIDDVEVAYQLGVSGSGLQGEALYRAVRSITGAAGEAFAAETRIPTPSPDKPPQNWRAADVEALWRSPIVGTAGTTVGMAVEQTLSAGGAVGRRLKWSGPVAFEIPALLGMRRWAASKARQAYHRGFIDGLTRDPTATVLAVIDNATDPCAGANAGDWPTGTDRSSPYPLGGHRKRPQLGLLVGGGQRVAEDGGGEPALRR